MVRLSKIQSDGEGGYEYTDFGGGEEELRYVSMPKDGFRGYIQMEITDPDMNMRPFNVFFVQAKSAYSISPQVVSRPAEAPAMRRSLGTGAVADLPDEIRTGIILKQGEQTDNTGLLLGDAFTQEYDYNALRF